MDTIRSLRTFVRVMELGSLSAAARQQQTTQPTVSKMMAALEKDLGVRLLERSTTSLTPTEQGRRFYVRAKQVIEEYDETVADVRGQTDKPQGFLRVNAPVGLGELRLHDLVLQFLEEHPHIDLELMLNDRFVDLVEEGVDIAIRLGGDLPPNVIARKIASSPRILVASPEYLKGKPKIRRPDDLARVNYLQFARSVGGHKIDLFAVDAKVTVTTHGRYQVNSSLAIRNGLLGGAGVGMSPAWLVQDLLESKQLVRVLPKWSGTPLELHLVYPSRRYHPLRARMFMQFMAEHLKCSPGFIAA